MAAPYEKIARGFHPLAELVPAHWQASDMAAPDGTRLHYTRTGGGKPPVLLLHGIQVNGLSWLRTARALEADYDVVMPDFRGHGASGGLENGFSAEVLVNDMRALIAGLGLDSPFVVGHSMGAEIAGRLAAVHPARAVVLVEPALQNFMAQMPPMDGAPPWMEPIFETIRALKSLPHAERMAAGLRLLPSGTPPWDEADYVSFVEAQAACDPAVFRHAAKLGCLFEAPDVIARIAAPVLLLTARSMMPGAGVEAGLSAFQNHWREGRHVHFEDAGHFLMCDQFERFIMVVRDFLRARGTPA